MDYEERARLAANTLHSRHTPEEAKAHSKPGRDAFLRRFKNEQERRAYFSELGKKSIATRKNGKPQEAVDERVLKLLRLAYPKPVFFGDLQHTVRTGRARLQTSLEGLVRSGEVALVGRRQYKAVPPPK